MSAYRRFSFKDGIYINKNAGREFDEGVKDLFPDVTAVCHHFSFAQIERTMFYTISTFTDPEDIEANLHNLVLAVVHLNQASEIYQNAGEMITNIAQNFVPQDVEQADFLCENLNNLLYMLNSAPENLRYGNSRWNSSIGEEFDPTAWCYINQSGVVSAHLGIQTPPANILMPAGPIGEGFYLYLPEEGAVLDYIIEQVKPEAQISIYTAINENYDKPFIYSSSNQGAEFYPTTHSKIKVYDKPIYYWGVKVLSADSNNHKWGWKSLT